MAKKFNLTDLLNQRSKETQEGQQEAEMQTEQDVERKEEIMMIDVFDLLPSKDNFYRVDDELKRSIELVGVLQPLLVKKPENGKYRVIAGHRRRLAVLSLIDEGKEERRYMPCIYKPEDVRDRLAIIMANRFRDKSDWEKMREAIEAEELAKELKREMKLEGRTRELLSEITGVTEAQLGRYKSIYNNLIPELMADFKEGNIIVSVAAELSGLNREWQQKAVEKIAEGGALSIAEAKELKKQQESSRQIPGQLSFAENGQQEQELEKTARDTAGEPQEDLCGTCVHNGECAGKKTHDSGCMGYEQVEEYEDPEPETIDSICYTCDRYETCHEKKSTVTKCNAYIDRREARKTEEQRYNEEQEEIDRKTRQKLRERAQEEKMEHMPGKEQRKEHDIKLAPGRYEEIISGKLTFLLLKKDGYRLGEEIRLPEFAAGKETGRVIEIEVQYIWEDWTGLEEDYCIIGFMVLSFG